MQDTNIEPGTQLHIGIIKFKIIGPVSPYLIKTKMETGPWHHWSPHKIACDMFSEMSHRILGATKIYSHISPSQRICGPGAVSQIVMPIRYIFNARPDRPIIPPAMAEWSRPDSQQFRPNPQMRSDRQSSARCFSKCYCHICIRIFSLSASSRSTDSGSITVNLASKLWNFIPPHSAASCMHQKYLRYCSSNI